MSEQTTDAAPEDQTPPADLGEQAGAPALSTGTDIDAAELDVAAGAGGDTPATSDPGEYVEDADLGGTHGPSSGGAG
jgi:hypothetical protein